MLFQNLIALYAKSILNAIIKTYYIIKIITHSYSNAKIYIAVYSIVY